MVRPKLCRKIEFNPNITYFKPQGVPLRELEVVDLTLEEIEALRLKNIKGLEQIEAAEKMGTSQSTFQRILASAYQKISDALINGKAIKIKNYLMVFSGKGGVGKTTVASNLAFAFARKGLKVGLLDADIHGPNLAMMLGAQGGGVVEYGENSIMPFEINKNLSLVSIAYFISSPDSPLIWRGPAKMKIIEKFVKDVTWGDLDWLIIDAPPGTGDEPLSIAQLLPQSGAVIVTTPQDVSLLDSKKAINFAKELKLKIYGLIENMSGFNCPHCGKEINLFKTGGGAKIAEQYEIPFLGFVPIDPRIVISSDNGNPLVCAGDSPAKEAFLSIADKIVAGKN